MFCLPDLFFAPESYIFYSHSDAQNTFQYHDLSIFIMNIAIKKKDPAIWCNFSHTSSHKDYWYTPAYM